MKFTKLTQKLKTTALSIFVAIAMLLSANFSSFYAMANFARYTSSVANAVYSAKTDNTFNFTTSESLTTSVSGNSSNYVIDRDASLIDAFSHVTNGKYFPIAKYNGFTALSEIRNDTDKISTEQLANDTADNYYGVISTNDYQVARKDYKKDGSEYVYETTELTTTKNEKTVTEDVNVIYVSATKKSSESTDDFNTRVSELKGIIDAINLTKTTPSGEVLYVYLDNAADNYDANDYTMINTDSDAYKEIGTDLTGKQIGGADVVQGDYRFYYKKTFEYIENHLAFKNNNTITLTNNSYYVLSVWVYTAGPDTTATIAVTGTNLNATIDNISTNGLWVQYYLFIETPAADSTNITFSLYYGDDNGVTGTRSLQSYANGTFPGTQEQNYTTNKITGTVAFDQLKVTSINQEEYINGTINGFTANEIAQASLAKGYSVDGANDTQIIENNKQATATTTGEGSDKVTTYTYSKVSYTSVNDLSKVARYSARVYKSPFSGFDASFQSLNGKTNSDLVYSFNDATSLDYNSYLNNVSSNMFTYYVPRYTADNNTTTLTAAAKQAYRDRYQNANVSYTAEEQAKYGTSQLWATIVAEDTEFEGYEKDKVDASGNKVEVEDEDGNKVQDKLEDVHNNTFINTPNETNYILKLENKSSYDLGLTSTAIYVPANSFLRVSVWAYSDNEDAIATAKLFSTIQESTTGQLGTLVLASTTATDFEYNSNGFNGWKELSFTIKGNPYQSCTAYLSLLASDNDTVYFDNIKVDNISSSNYTSGSSKLNLSDKAILKSNITNGLFNNITVNSSDPINTYPYTAESWTEDTTVTSDSVIHGVINTNSDQFNNAVIPAYNAEGKLDYYDQNYITFNGTDYYYTKDGNVKLVLGENYLVDYKGDFVKATTLAEMFDTTTVPVTKINDILQAQGLPGYSDADNYTLPESNVYAAYLPEATDDEEKDPSFLIKSSNFSSLNSNSVYKVTFQAWIDANFNGKLVAKLIYDNKPVTDIELNIDKTNPTAKTGAWHTFTIYIRTGNTSRSSISLQLGATESTGTVFFQNVNYSTLAEKTESGKKITVNEQFDELLKKYPTIDSQSVIVSGKVQYVRFVDMHNNNFTMHSTEQDDKTYLYESYGYVLATKSSSDKYTQGTIGVINTDTTDDFMFEDSKVNVANNPNTTTNTALLIKNENTTDYTVVNSLFNTTLSSNKYYKITFYVRTSDMGDKGLNVTASGLNEHFKNINTTGVVDNNGWSKYTIYTEVGSSSITSFSLSFTLGVNATESFKGWALVSNISVDEIQADEYTADIEKDEIKNSDNVIIKSTKTTTPEVEEKDDEQKFDWATFFLVFSSVLLVVALVIALVAVITKKKAKKHTTDAAANGGIESNDTQETGGIE